MNQAHKTSNNAPSHEPPDFSLVLGGPLFQLLMALPLLIGAEFPVHRRLRLVVAQFIDPHIITKAVLPRFKAIIASAMKLRNSAAIELIMLILVFVGGHYLWSTAAGIAKIGTRAASWYATATDGSARPVFPLPAATDDLLGEEKWGAGPTSVVLKQRGPWTYGLLGNHIWSFAGEQDRSSVNRTFLQPFLSYTTRTFTSFGLNTESTYHWQAHQWNVPINAFVQQLLKIGKQPLALLFGGRYYAEGPGGGPAWGLCFQISFLFPKK